jgi:DNA polymerase-3 subunit gamma/tau
MAHKRTKPAEPATTGPYQVVARRFRPQTFDELVGQDDVLQSLKKALEQRRVPHAFLFAGSRGVGKTTSARILARCLNCERGPTAEPCGTCAACRSILDGSNPDVMEIDAASNRGVDDVRRLRESIGFATMQSRYRVVILDEAHMMTKEAFNAFLKTLEEPPPQVVFVLATTELHKVPETIRSRCQVLLFHRVGEPDLQRRLRSIADKEGVAVPDDVLAEIAAAVKGGVRDAETALERVLPIARDMGAGFDLAAYRTLVARVGTDAVVDVVTALLAGDAKAGLHFARERERQGADEREALGEIVDALRWLLLLKIDGADSVLVPLAGALRERLQAMAEGVDEQRLDAMIGAGLLGRERLRRLEDRAAVFEVALVRMAQAASLPTLADLLAEVRGGAPVVPPAAAAAPAPRRAGAAIPPAAPPAAPRPVAPPASGDDLKARTLAALGDRGLIKRTIELCRIDGPDAQGLVVVTLDSEQRLHRDRLQAPVQQQELTEVIAHAAGRPVRVEFRCGGSAGDASRESPAAAVQPGPRAKRVLDTFGGRVVQVDPQDRIGKAPRTDAAGDEPPPASDPGETHD